MKTAAVVAEYNPFHSGHKYQLEMTRKAGASHVVCIMSGNFVQRGEPAIYDKFLRARAAVECGADLVVELPLAWATGTAQVFARGAVGIAKQLGCVDMLSFGCENAKVQELEALARVTASPEFENLISTMLSSDSTFAALREQAVAQLCGAGTAALLKQPNNILAVEYIAAARKLNCGFEFNAVARLGDGYNDKTYGGSGFASATAIREEIRNNSFSDLLVPEEIKSFYTADFSDYSRLETAVLSVLRGLTVEQIAQAPDISEGLENRIYRAIRESCSLSELFENIKTKRYTAARIRRVVLSLYLGIKAEDSKGIPPYIRILACGEKGREILAAAESECPVVGRAAQFKQLKGRAGELFELECRADDIYALSFSPPGVCGAYHKNKIF